MGPGGRGAQARVSVNTQAPTMRQAPQEDAESAETKVLGWALCMKGTHTYGVVPETCREHPLCAGPSRQSRTVSPRG